MLEAVVLGRPHLVLPHAGHDERLAPGQVRDLLDHVLGLDRFVVPVVAERELSLPAPDLLRPLLAGLAGQRGDALAGLALQLLDQPGEHPPAVADDGDVHLDVLGDGRGIDVDVDDLGVGREHFHLPRHPVVEPRPDRDQAVRVMDRHVGVVRAVHAEHFEGERVLRREGAEPHQRRRHGGLGHLGQAPDFFRGVRGDDTAAHVEHGTLGPQDRARGLLDLAGVPVVGGVIRAEMDLVRVLEGPLLHQDVLGQIHMDRSRAAGGRDVERLLDGLAQIPSVLYEEVVLGAGARDPDVVGLLEGVVADHMGRYLAGEGDDRDGVHVSVLERGHQIGGRRPRRDEGDSDLPRGPGVSLGRMTRRRFLTNEDVAQPGEVIQGVVDRQHRPARQPEHHVHSLPLQTLQKDPRSREFHCQLFPS